MATHRAPTRPRDTANPALAYLSILIGLTGCAASWLPWQDTLIPLVVAGWLAGVVGIWWSRQWAAGVGVVLCGTAVILSVMFHTELGGWLAAAEVEPPPVMMLNGDCQ
jgi:hypothetical protein